MQNLTSSKFHTKPPGERHNGMMINMEEGELVVLFTQNKEKLWNKDEALAILSVCALQQKSQNTLVTFWQGQETK